MRILVDTNRYTDFCKAVPEAVAPVTAAEHVFLPFVTLAELRGGFQTGTLARSNEQTLARFLASGRVSVLYPDDTTTQVYAGLFTQLRRQGTPIPTNDIWIAAIALQHNLALLSRDGHFDNIPQLRRT
jgi:predicted nucleic acid-binding protein